MGIESTLFSMVGVGEAYNIFGFIFFFLFDTHMLYLLFYGSHVTQVKQQTFVPRSSGGWEV